MSESTNGARFVHDTLELVGWDVELADAVRFKGPAPLACKTDKVDALVLAEPSRRDMVPAIWLPSPEIARFPSGDRCGTSDHSLGECSANRG